MTDNHRSSRFFAGKTWAALFMVISLGISLAGYIYYRAETGRIEQDKYREIAAIATLKVKQIQQWRLERLHDVRIPAESPFFRNAVQRWLQGGNPTQLGTELLDRLRLELASPFDEALLISPEGKILLSTKANPDPICPITMRAVKAALADLKPHLSDFYRCSKGRVHIASSVAVFDSSGKPLAVIVQRSEASGYLYPLIQSWPVPSKSAESLLVRREGENILFLNELRHKNGTALSLRIALDKTDLPASHAVLGTVGKIIGRDYRGVEVLADLRPVTDSPWFLVTKVDAYEILSEARYRAVVVVVLAGSLILLTAALIASGYRSCQASLYRDLYQTEQEQREARKEFRTILYSIGDAVITTDGEGKVRLMNQVAEQLTGWREAEALGKPLQEVFHIINEQSRLEVESPGDIVLREGKVVGLVNHTILITRDGTELPIDDSGAPICDEHGKVVGVVLVFRDVTNRRYAERELTIFRQFAEQSQEGLGMADMTGRITYANQALCRMLEADSVADLVGRSIREFYLPDDLCDLDSKILPAVLEQGSQTIEQPLRSLRGTALPTIQSLFTIRSAEGAPLFFANVITDITVQKQTEATLRSYTDRLQSIFRVAPIGIGVVRNRMFQEVNRKMCEMTGYDEDELVGESTRILYSSQEEYERVGLEKYNLISERGTGAVETIWQKKDGSFIDVYLASTPLDPDDLLAGVTFTALDMTDFKRVEEERDRMENQFIQAQKMEAVGRLAGGVAHDFNNMLSVILGYADLALGKLADSDPIYRYIQEIHNAGKRSADLTRQLLAFARRQTIMPKILDLNDTISGMLKMLMRLIGENIDLTWKPSAGIGPIKMDPVQIDQILANLVVNARDAVSGIGQVTIETGVAEFDAASSEFIAGVVPGQYVMLAVSDNGCGMDEEIKEHLFEPFFTTKDPGKGTGLGLATIYGIVKQNSGFINVYSELGRGTTIRIYLPRYESEPEALGLSHVEPALPTGTETILLVEDERALLSLSVQMLEKLGYIVLACDGPDQALTVAREFGGVIHLVVTDVVMPEMSGRDLCLLISEQRPDIRCLFMSGYTAEVIASHGVLHEGIHFLQKPFSVRDLAQKVHETLNE